jgi:molecular chaperone DnaK
MPSKEARESGMTMGYLLGIDVGTTRTAASTGRADAGLGDFEIVNLGDRSSSVPSVLYLGKDATVLVGDAAERRTTTDPDRVVREFKRRIGDPTPIVVAGRNWAPEELSARLVRWVVDRVAEREGGPADRIAITHPAAWGGHKKERLTAALAGYGITASFLAEPQAAALHYAAAERVESGSTIAVYDLGGGTFDAAVVHKDGNGFALTGRPEGVERLGGIDFDEVVFEHVRAGLPEAFEGLDDTDPAVLSAVAAIRRECTEAKEALSSDTDVSIAVLTPAGQGSVRLHRSEFEAMIRPRIEETVDALRRAVTSAGLEPDQLSTVLLVGGSSRIPLVAELVSEQLGRPVAVDTDPKNAIAKGAALSLHPVGLTATGVGQVPLQREARHAAETGAIPWYAAPQPAPGLARPVPQTAGPQFAGAPLQRAAMGAPLPPGPPRPAYPDRPQAVYRPPGPVSTQPQPGRNPAMLVSIGGLSAAVAVIATLFLVPSTPSNAVPTPVADVPSTSYAPPTTTTTLAPTTTIAPAPEPAPVPAPAPRRTTRRVVPPPPPPPTTPPTTTTTTTTAPPTSDPPSSDPPSSNPPSSNPPSSDPSDPPEPPDD